jgi:phage shock protein PspC (stress-responsive transcriptional regulator)
MDGRRHRLTRSRKRLIAGVCGGLAEYLGWSPTLVRVLYVAVSVFTGLVAGSAVYNALTQDPALWPSELWRYGGAVLNGVGRLAAIRAVVSFVVSRSGR